MVLSGIRNLATLVSFSLLVMFIPSLCLSVSLSVVDCLTRKRIYTIHSDKEHHVYSISQSSPLLSFPQHPRPLERDIGRYTYLLEALDSENGAATDTVMIHIQQPQRGRNFNHRFTATFILQKEYEFNSSLRTLDWKVSETRLMYILVFECSYLCKFVGINLFSLLYIYQL